MNDMILGVLKELPSTGALIVIVMAFLKFMAARAKEAEKIMGQHDDAMRQIADKYDSTAKTAIETLKENSLALGRVAGVIERIGR